MLIYGVKATQPQGKVAGALVIKYAKKEREKEREKNTSSRMWAPPLFSRLVNDQVYSFVVVITIPLLLVFCISSVIFTLFPIYFASPAVSWVVKTYTKPLRSATDIIQIGNWNGLHASRARHACVSLFRLRCWCVVHCCNSAISEGVSLLHSQHGRTKTRWMLRTSEWCLPVKDRILYP